MLLQKAKTFISQILLNID